jgi:ParB family transcriptional regulator, chromosome partitioning protein
MRTGTKKSGEYRRAELRRHLQGIILGAAADAACSTWNIDPTLGKDADMSTKAQQRPRLGRGLNSLISVTDLPVESEVSDLPLPDPAGAAARNEANSSAAPTSPSLSVAETPAESSGEPLSIQIDRIHPNPHQPRQSFDPVKIAELAASIKSTGLIQPIVVRRAGEDYQLIAGERRWRAAQLAGMASVPAIVREVGSFEQAQMALVENIQREDLNPIDRAASYRTLMDQLSLTQAELAARLGEERSSVANFVRLLELAEPVRQMVRSGTLSMGHAKLIAGVGDGIEQERLANVVATQDLSVRNLERLLSDNGPATPAPNKATPGTSAHLSDLETNITRHLGMRVQIRSSGKKGRVVIHYASLDEFDALLDRLGVKVE